MVCLGKILAWGAITFLLPLTTTPQETDYTCGTAVTRSVLKAFGHSVSEAKLAEELKSNDEDGTDLDAIVEVSQNYGLSARVEENFSLAALRTAIEHRQSVAVLFDAWETGHFAAVIGIDESFVYLMDPMLKDGYGYVPLLDFLRRWQGNDRLRGDVVHAAVIWDEPLPPGQISTASAQLTLIPE